MNTAHVRAAAIKRKLQFSFRRVWDQKNKGAARCWSPRRERWRSLSALRRVWTLFLQWQHYSCWLLHWWTDFTARYPSPIVSTSYLYSWGYCLVYWSGAAANPWLLPIIFNHSGGITQYVSLCAMCSHNEAAVRWNRTVDNHMESFYIRYECRDADGSVVIPKDVSNHGWVTVRMLVYSSQCCSAYNHACWIITTYSLKILELWKNVCNHIWRESIFMIL